MQLTNTGISPTRANNFEGYMTANIVGIEMLRDLSTAPCAYVYINGIIILASRVLIAPPVSSNIRIVFGVLILTKIADKNGTLGEL
jgi:hypothetical protein